MVREGHHGITRFGRFGTEMVLGQLGFGENSLYPTCFDGPGGCRGAAPGAPVLGSPDRRLRAGDLVFVDCACGVQGYHTDKTVTYVYKGSLPDEAIEAHHRCVEVQDEIATLLRPGICTLRDLRDGDRRPRSCVPRELHGVRGPAGAVPGPRHRPRRRRGAGDRPGF